jgi:hypothetical protein
MVRGFLGRLALIIKQGVQEEAAKLILSFAAFFMPFFIYRRKILQRVPAVRRLRDINGG